MAANIDALLSLCTLLAFHCPLSALSIRQLLIHPHQLRHAACLSGSRHVEPIRLHDGPVVLLVGLAQLGGHGDLVVEVGKGAVRVEGAGVQDGLGGLLDFGFLGVGGGGPGEVVVDSWRVAIITFQPSANGSHPGHMNI